ncbi:helix-turn-helix domain-containing protein [Brachybacterium sp. GPGPB12]|uniref:TetR/AcrR family transcriptional regulator n=1 Tax=Brachybacterium sp. GPGPB12 TaxID=3023517 RepID=UPI00313452AC
MDHDGEEGDAPRHDDRCVRRRWAGGQSAGGCARNRARILAATATAIRKNPDASVGDIAAEAGMGRVTVYGHFPTRAELIEAALVDSLERGEDVLSGVPLDGDPGEAFRRLVASSWVLVDQSRAAGDRTERTARGTHPRAAREG